MKLTDEGWVLERLRRAGGAGVWLERLHHEYRNLASGTVVGCGVGDHFGSAYRRFCEGINELRRRKLVYVKRGVCWIRDDLRDLIRDVEKNSEKAT